jgi:hypothetical protein
MQTSIPQVEGEMERERGKPPILFPALLDTLEPALPIFVVNPLMEEREGEIKEGER